MPRQPTPIRANGIPWYRREDYAEILRVMADGELLPKTWDKWFYRAEKVRQQIVDSGGIAERCNIDPQQFPLWCRTRGLNVDARARELFVSEQLVRRYGPMQ